MKTYQCMFFGFQCNACKHKFDGPLLPDQESYGYFLLSRPKGRFGIVETIANKETEAAWEEIKGLVSGNNDLLQRVFAACLDPYDGEIWELGFICPKCDSRDIRFGDSDMKETHPLEMPGFSSFNALTLDGKKSYIEDAKQKIRARLKEVKAKSQKSDTPSARE